MANLFVDAVRCVSETDETGSDDVYLVVFRGDPKPPFNSNLGVHGPGQPWSDFDTGELDPTDVSIAKFFPDAVYVVMLVEEDDGRDLSGSDIIDNWKLKCGIAWRNAMLSIAAGGHLPPTPALAAAAAQSVGDAMRELAKTDMEFPTGNDDPIGSPQQVVIAPGQTPTLVFKSGDGGVYRIRFKVQ
jgi:hypothetical protein